MRINPINTNNNTNFQAIIRPSNSLKEGFEMAQKTVHNGTTKDLNSVKEFLDSLVRISETKKIKEYKIDIDKRRPDYTYTKINGKRVIGVPTERNQNIQDAYLVVEGTKKYASNLEDVQPFILDILKTKIEETENLLDELKDRYSKRIQAELEQAQKLIFKDAE